MDKPLHQVPWEELKESGLQKAPGREPDTLITLFWVQSEVLTKNDHDHPAIKGPFCVGTRTELSKYSPNSGFHCRLPDCSKPNDPENPKFGTFDQK